MAEPSDANKRQKPEDAVPAFSDSISNFAVSETLRFEAGGRLAVVLGKLDGQDCVLELKQRAALADPRALDQLAREPAETLCCRPYEADCFGQDPDAPMDAEPTPVTQMISESDSCSAMTGVLISKRKSTPRRWTLIRGVFIRELSRHSRER